MDFPNQTPQPVQPVQPPSPVTPPQPVAPTPQPPTFQPPVAAPAPTMTGAPAGMSMPPSTPTPPMTPPTMPTQAPTPIQIPVQAQPGQAVGEDQVYTMPDKFLQQTPAAGSKPAKKPHKGLTIALIVIIVLALLGIIGGVLFYVLQVLPAQNQTTDTIVVDNTANDNQVNNLNNVNATNDNVNNVNTVNANDNSNAVVNDNTNANTNENENENGNVNETNANTNTNDNSNTNAAVNDNINTTTTVTPLPSSKDTDADEITNEEEKIWGTKADLPDTDSDGYNDGAEILAGYDPLNPTSTGRLIDSGALGTYANKDYGYDIYYPVDWLAEALSEGATNEVLFTPDSLDTAGQFVEVIVEENPAGLTALDWYVDQTKVDESELEIIVTDADLEGVWSLDGNTAYFATNNNVYAVSYRYGNSTELYFKTTFTMMVNSFTLTKKAQNANDAVSEETTNTNADTNTNANTNTNTATTNTNTVDNSNIN